MAITPLDYVKAEAFRIGWENIFGSKPPMEIVGNEYIEITFTDEQKEQFAARLDKQFWNLFTPTEEAPPNVQIRWGQIIIPWSAKYMVAAAGLTFGAGYLTKKAKG